MDILVEKRVNGELFVVMAAYPSIALFSLLTQMSQILLQKHLLREHCKNWRKVCFGVNFSIWKSIQCVWGYQIVFFFIRDTDQ